MLAKLLSVILFGVAVVMIGSVAGAEKVTLATPETISVPTAPTMDWYVDEINATTKTLKVKYRWLDGTGNVIQKIGSTEGWMTWTCQERPAQLPESCTGIGEPYGCCTGSGTSNGQCDNGDNCFSSVFAFSIRSQDVGTRIGIGLRALIWNQFKADVLATGNTGTFDSE